ncbi:hypothetical protein KR074_005853 [Drosophila pseudoananassae]|nr:hypothetical protein KR074_005853 [Drosophila pseudoananassae]
MASPSCLLTVLGLTVLAALRADSLPITSRPIEGPIQRMVWEDWVNLGPEEQALVAHKKVTAKSIFTLPFRHCPPHHTLYNELCIPQSNINPNQLIVQELILAETGNGKPPPAPIADYDYGDEPEESDEIAFDIGGIPPAMSPPSGQDQALPSEDAPLKFNIFEKKFPTGTGEPDTDLLGAIPPPAVPPAPKASNASTTTTPPPPPLPLPQGDGPMDGNRIANGDLQASSSNALATTATLTLPSSTTTSTTTSRIDIGNVEAIVLPADGSSVQLVTGSLNDDDGGDEADAKASATHNPNAEADLAQLLKDDAFVPAYEGSIEVLQPPFSHRRVSPPLSAVLDVKTTTQMEDDMEIEGSSEESDDTTTTDIVPVSGEEEVDASTTIATDDDNYDDDETTDIMESSLTPTTMNPETTASSSSSTLLVPDIDEGKNGLVLIKSKVQPVQVTTTTASGTASVTEAYTSSTSDRFHYQHFEDVAASSTTSETSETPATSTESTSSSNSIRNASELLEESDNLMTNTIGEEDGHKTTSEINVQQELKLINELVKSKRLSQLRKQQEQAATSTEATSSSQAWSKVMPELATSSATSSATSTTTETALPETTTSQAATTTISINNRSNRNSKIIRVEPSPSAATATAATETATKTTLTSNSNTSDGYTPFWWLPNIGWRLDRQVDGNGEDRSLLLRFFSTFRGSDRSPMR